ncbi:MAG TPA: hypothetical protein VIL46_10745, partial [Gemmataceae bacterium]
AGLIVLLEPVLTPLWAYLLVPARETPPPETWAGATLILGALAWRYRPGRRAAPAPGVIRAGG